MTHGGASPPRALALAALAGMLACAPSARAITSGLADVTPRKTTAEARATQLQASLMWKEVSPPNRDVYMAIGMSLGEGLPARNGAVGACNSGYMGAQFHAGGYNTLLWSMSGREEGQIVPVGEYCHYDCFDCSPPNRRDFQCKRDDYALSLGVSYTFTLQMEMQNASGAMWSVTVSDPTAADAGHPIEVGRVFFKDREFGFRESTCRVLGVRPYMFQEYWNPRQQDQTARASWSAVTYSGVMTPQETRGYCQGGKPASLADFEGLTLAECKGRCAAEERCLFASYSDRDPYAKRDGSHCMLFDRCAARDTYLADIWWTYEKVDVPTLAVTGIPEMCQHFKDQNCDSRTAVAEVRRLPGGPVEFEFDVGKDVRCKAGAVPEEIESLAGGCDARGARLAGPGAPALRGSALAASAVAAAAAGPAAFAKDLPASASPQHERVVPSGAGEGRPR